MAEILFLIGTVAILTLSSYSVLRIGKVKGLRSYRGAAVFLLLLLSWGIGWLLAQVYVPLTIIVPFFVQLFTLNLAAKVPYLKSVVLSSINVLLTVAILFGVAYVTIGAK